MTELPNDPAELEALIEAAQAKLNAMPPEPDLSEAVEVFGKTYMNHDGDLLDSWRAGLIAAYPALYKALGPRPPWPGEEELEAMKDSAWDGSSRGSMGNLARRIKEWQGAQVATPEPTEDEAK